MIGGLTSFQGKGSDWGENLLNSVASNTLRHLFTQCDQLEVKVSCHPSSKLLQGSIDSFNMSGKGLVIRKAFRTEEMWFETDAVAIDFSSALKGKITLKQPTQAIAQVKLLEEDINQAFKAQLVRKRLENLTAPTLTELSGGDPVSFTDINLTLLPNNQIQIDAKADLGQAGVIPVSLTCTLGVERRRRLLYKNVTFQADNVPKEHQVVSEKLTEVLGDILNNMVDLDRFNLDGVKMRINRLETQGKTLVFSGYAQINHIPRQG
ncbi:DUF2993 domain-containing protein [Euhalothece natronophila Z-M001]|uniref:DUF2993 domain-containing protein n=1 Tax=Euhalothece natronophila Z-M001 TaxID=522448 RepID=A0A5B8NPB1_9CHRO|nr:DUF2993 domain-containing protein [Euhalothece natronophila]QDZ40776.1 DUF2993 domain-containing protein [Euhalothece natronophila Z-M001]